MGSAFHAWQSLLPPKPGRETPASDLVKSIIGIKERKAERERRDRVEARQAELDAQTQIDTDRRRQLEDAQQTAMLAATLSGEMDAPAERLGGAPELLPLGEGVSMDVGAEALPPGLRPQVDRPEMMQDLSLFGIEESVAAPFREELLQMKGEEAMLSPSVISAATRAGARREYPTEGEKWQSFQREEKLKDELRTNREKQLIKLRSELKPVAAGPGEKPPKQISPKVGFEMADMSSLAAKTQDLMQLEADYKYYGAKLVPDVVLGFMAEETDTDWAKKTLNFEPAYFLYTAQMLKAVQGSRPSDKDMEWYLQNMPRLNDTVEQRDFKVNWLLRELGTRYNGRLKWLEDANYDTSGLSPMTVPDIGAQSRAAGPVGITTPSGQYTIEAVE